MRPLAKSLLLALVVCAAQLRSDPVADTSASTCVKPIDFNRLERGYAALPERDRNLVQMYMKGARRYVLTLADGAFPDPGSEYWRNIAERAHGAAVLAAIPSDWPDDLKQKCRRESAQFVIEFAAEFERRHDFGNAWQSAWWAGEMGTAGWFVWDELDPAIRERVANMIVFHADRIAAKQPGAKVEGDTEAETVSWNSTVLSLAVNMMPAHPHSAIWQSAAKRYVYTVFGTSADLQDTTPGDDGKPVKDWVAGANIHDDFSLENHNRFHIDYVYSGYRFVIGGAALYRLAGNPLPRAFAHHFKEVHENVIVPCLDGSKFAVYVSDNDWKRYHIWTESAAVHGYVSLVTSSPLASALEQQALSNATAYWNEFQPGFEYENPYVCGKAWTPRIADIVLLHILSRPAPTPLPAAEVETALRGTHEKRDVHLLSQYSSGASYRSFFWGPGPVVRYVEPSDNAWMLLPLESNYRMHVSGKPLPGTRATTRSAKGSDWFWAIRSHPHGEQEGFVSLPDEMVITMTSISDRALSGAKTLDSHVAVEKPHKEFTVFYDGGKAVYHPGAQQWDSTRAELNTRWVNLADSIGYAVFSAPDSNPGIQLPECGKRSELRLYSAAYTTGPLTVVTCTFPNQKHDQTELLTSQIKISSANGVVTCMSPHNFVLANFSNAKLPAALGCSGMPAIEACEPQTAQLWHRKDLAAGWTKIE